MAQLFAAYLTQKLPSAHVSGKYDPEQELWVGDNQLQGATHTLKNTLNGTTDPTTHLSGNGFTDRDTGSDNDTYSDSDNG
jgi:hypothetical protein